MEKSQGWFSKEEMPRIKSDQIEVGAGPQHTLPKYGPGPDWELVASRISDPGTGDVVFAAGANLLLTNTNAIIKIGAGLAENAFGYLNGTGPQFLDDSTANKLIFNVQSLSSNRTFTWPNVSATVAVTTGSLTDKHFVHLDPSGRLIQSELILEDGSSLLPVVNGGTDLGSPPLAFRQLFLNATITPVATVGAQTIDKAAGSVNFAAAATSLVVTCDKCTENSIVIATVATNDSALKSVQAVPANGSFTLFGNAPANAETRVNFWVLNQ